MSNSTRRCRNCRQFRPADQLKVVGLQAQCAGGCDSIPPPKASKPRRSAATGKPKVSVDIDPETRRQVLSRDGWQCAWCAAKRMLEVHHIDYRSGRSIAAGRHHPTNLISLCDSCHARAHSNKRRWQPLLRLYIWLLYVEGRRTTVAELEATIAA